MKLSMEAISSTTITDLAALFIKEILDLREQTVQVGRLLDLIMQKHPTFIDVLVTKTGRAPSWFHNLRNVGRERLIAEMFPYAELPGPKKIQRLSCEAQQKLLTDQIEYFCPKSKEVLTVSLLDLTRDQADQIFDNSGRMRSVQAQRLWVEDKNAKTHATEVIKVSQPYHLNSRTLRVIQPCEFTKKDLVNILARMESA